MKKPEKGIRTPRSLNTAAELVFDGEAFCSSSITSSISSRDESLLGNARYSMTPSQAMDTKNEGYHLLFTKRFVYLSM